MVIRSKTINLVCTNMSAECDKMGTNPSPKMWRQETNRDIWSLQVGCIQKDVEWTLHDSVNYINIRRGVIGGQLWTRYWRRILLQDAGTVLPNRKTNSFSRRTLLRGVNLNLMACYICEQTAYNWASFACISPLYSTGNLVAYIPGETLALSKIDVLLMK